MFFAAPRKRNSDASELDEVDTAKPGREVLMSGQHFRFLHAGGFLLDQPLAGLTEIPEPLTDLLIDAPFTAAQKVFDAAIEERVDFVVLNGDLLDLSRPSARAIAFLARQFRSAAEHKAFPSIGPAASSSSRTIGRRRRRCPIACSRFRSTEPEELSHFRGDRPVANIVGRSWHGTASFQVGEFRTDDDGLPTIVVANGNAMPSDSAEQMVDYWALGGQPQRQTAGYGRTK